MKLIWIVALLGLSLSAFAERVRTLTVDDKKMYPVYLMMGRSTVLSFEEKPKKVVIGNKNYYELEFVEGKSHITLQPQGNVTTNMFVYGAKNVYGFILKTRSVGGYDDLIKVKWKDDKKFKRVKGKLLKVPFFKEKIINKSIYLGKLKIFVKRALKIKKDSYALDLEFLNTGKNKVNLDNIRIQQKEVKDTLKIQRSFLKKIILALEKSLDFDYS